MDSLLVGLFRDEFAKTVDLEVFVLSDCRVTRLVQSVSINYFECFVEIFSKYIE